MSKEQNPTTHRKKTVAVATVALVVVLGVGAWAISSALSAVSKNKNSKPAETSQNSSADSTEDAKNTSLTDDSAVKKEQTPKQNATNSVAQNNSQPAAPTAISTPSAQYTAPLPTTGPTENFISAIALGVIVALIAHNVQLKKKLSSNS